MSSNMDKIGRSRLPKGMSKLGVASTLYTAITVSNIFTTGNGRRLKNVKLEFNDENCSIEQVDYQTVRINLNKKMIDPDTYPGNEEWWYEAYASIMAVVYHETLHRLWTKHLNLEQGFDEAVANGWAVATWNKEVWCEMYNILEDVHIEHYARFADHGNELENNKHKVYSNILLASNKDIWSKTDIDKRPWSFEILKLSVKPDYLLTRKPEAQEIAETSLTLAEHNSSLGYAGELYKLMSETEIEEMQQQLQTVKVSLKGGKPDEDMMEALVAVFSKGISSPQKAKTVFLKAPANYDKITQHKPAMNLDRLRELRRIKLDVMGYDVILENSRGKRINLIHHWNPEKCFLDEVSTRDDEEPIEIVMLLDFSGSMQEKYGMDVTMRQYVTQVCFDITKILDSIRVPYRVYGHTTASEGVVCYKLFKSNQQQNEKNTAYKFAFNGTGGGNTDGQVIYDLVHLKTTKLAKKAVYFVLCDGLPCGNQFMRDGGELVKWALTDAAKYDILIYGIALIQDVIGNIQKLYGSNAVDGTNGQLGKAIMDKIFKDIKHGNR